MAKKRGKKKEKIRSIPKISRKKAVKREKKHIKRQKRSFLNKLKAWQLAELLGVMFGIIIGAILTTISILPYPMDAFIVLKIIGFVLMLPLVIPYSIIIMIPYCAGGCVVIYFILGILVYAFIGALCGPLILKRIEEYRKKYKIR